MLKPKPIVTVQQKAFFLFICVAVFILGIFLTFSLLSNSKGLLNTDSSIYTEAYRPRIEQAQENRRLEALQKKREAELGLSDPGSNDSTDDESGQTSQPKPLGFSEKDIYKAKGRRYQTW